MFVGSFNGEAFASSSLKEYNIDIQGDMLNNAKVISKIKSQEDPYTEVTTIIYQLENGRLVTDTLSVFHSKSADGSDTATRTLEQSGRFSITITATFKWYDGKNSLGIPTSYVKCSSMSASYTTYQDFVNSKFEKSHTSDYIGIGTAYAKVDYYFYSSSAPFLYNEGTFKITCSDEGTISDNGK